MADKAGPPHLLMTRPRAASESFVAALVAHRVPMGEVVISPAISIEHLTGPVDPAGFGGVVVTSAHALHGVVAPPGMTAWCVGDATAEEAARAGFDAVSAGGDADDLVRLVASARPGAPLLYLRGQHVSAGLRDALAALGIAVEERVVYDQPESRPTAAALDLFSGVRPVVLPLFSPRTARIVAGWVEGASAPFRPVAMSEAVAAAWGRPAPIAARPNVRAMVAAVAEALAREANG